MTTPNAERELPPDPMGFREMHNRWRKIGTALEVPIPDDHEREAQLWAFATNLEAMMRDPGTRERLEREHAWRLEQLIAWTARRPW